MYKDPFSTIIEETKNAFFVPVSYPKIINDPTDWPTELNDPIRLKITKPVIVKHLTTEKKDNKKNKILD